MRVLSLFDGISCGRIALERIGITPEYYYASEVDKFAIAITKKNYPDTIHIGDVCQVDGKDYQNIDLLLGGSPCQGFSLAGNNLNFKDPRSVLFFEYLRILKESKPRYFLFENVKMKPKIENEITRLLGVDPVVINSSLVSGQNRLRYYWTNIPNITQPEDKGIILADVIDDGCVDRMKAYCLDANYSKGTNLEHYLTWNGRQIVFKEKSACELAIHCRENEKEILKRGQMGQLVSDLEQAEFRKLTPLECERLQTVPEGYTEGVSNTQRYKMLGNGWTIDIIAHILGGLKNGMCNK